MTMIDSPPVFRPERDAQPEEIYDYYARFREAERVAWTEPQWPTGEPGLALLRFEDVHQWLRDPRLGKEWRRLMPSGAMTGKVPAGTFTDLARNFMLLRDPPAHTRLRSTANMAFTPRRVEAMHQPIQALADRLVVELKRQNGPVDLIRSFAYPMPVLVIAGLLGVPDEDFPRFRDWAAVVAASLDLPVAGLEAFVARADQTARELSEYLGWIVDQRRSDPRDDLISALIAAETEEGKIDHDELIATLVLLLVAGHETTVNLIGNGTLALMRDRDQWSALVGEPSLARNATEELLRFDSPVQMTTRFAMEELEIAGVTIPLGTSVFFGLGSANRDPRVFDQPDRLDICREVGRIMSFGMGIHFCLGSPLARLEGEIAFRTLAREFPSLRLADETPKWRPGLILRGLAELPVILS